MQTYDFPYYEMENVYPESSAVVQFGRGYKFASKPSGPDQTLYTLHYTTMRFYWNADGTVNINQDIKMNMGKLDQFYRIHRMFTPFIFPHDLWGDVICRFAAPLSWKVAKGGRGWVEPFTVQLELQPV